MLASKKPRGAKADMLNSVSVAREETRRGDTRAGDRHRLPQEQVRVAYNGKSHDVQLINLSGGGAMVEGDFAPLLWDRVDLHLGGDGVIECAVRWLRDDRVGLEFAHETRLECSADERASVLRETINRSFPDIAFETSDEEPAPAAPEPAAIEDGRRERRHPLIWSGIIHHDYQSTPVRLRNISSTGALIECEQSLRVGAEPLLDLGDAGQVFATVTWRIGDQAGLKFQKHFDLAQLARAKPQVASKSWNAPTYLTSEPAAGDTPWGRMSLSELRDELEGFMKR
ncbi:PilZ domain-containing protein [Sphingomonas lutea]|uniref:PilZ domain-containing protein n=1 Tax=Sphingomonas lutea TaxID=1045317 RepID=A0A7G9SGI1_9SPHN|nr:PilZ domain-containing protein [Sphingomonas lutea]QNN66956.1 PilZ domain-containing protein [Sphingomonas lutea]